jgi:HPt (histidine-containing phosphotransfer) domain-containing protein
MEKTMSTLSAAKQEKLDALRRSLAARLPGIVADLETACRGFLAFPSDAEKHERAVRGSHTLAGTAGTFGYHEMGRAARALEFLLRGPAPAAEVEAHLAQVRAGLPTP